MGINPELEATLERIRLRRLEAESTSHESSTRTEIEKYHELRKSEILRCLRSVPPAYRHANLDDLVVDDFNREAVEECRNYVSNASKRRHRGVNLVITGPKGTGKTHLAWSVVRAVFQAPRVGVVPCSSDTWIATQKYDALSINQVQSHFWLDVYRAEQRGISNQEHRSIIGALCKAEWLFLDELGAPGTGTEFERSLLFEVVDHRSRMRRPTIVTTNLQLGAGDESGLEARTEDRLLERGHCILLGLEGPSRRA